MPTDFCKETAPGIFSREWTKASIQLDCNAFEADIAMHELKTDDVPNSGGVGSGALHVPSRRLKADEDLPSRDEPQTKSGGLAENSTVLLSEHQLSNQTREWWRWVLVRVTGFVEFVNTDEDREEFVREWNPDLFDWAGDYRMNVNEWARLHGIAMAAGQELEYEEAQFWFNAAEPNIVNTTWGSDGLNVNVNGELMTEGTFAPYMTHVAPKWHVAVEQGNSRHGRAGMADSMAQDNAIGIGIHGDSGWGFGFFEEKRFVEQWGQRLGLNAGFSIAEYARGLLAISQPGDNQTCWPHYDMLGTFGIEAHQYDGGTVADCCLSCANQTGCTGFTWYGDPLIHGRVLCMKTNDTTFKKHDTRNVSGGMCNSGRCNAGTCSACVAGAAGSVPLPPEDLVQDPIVHAFVEFIFTSWRRAWKDVAQSTKAAAEEAGVPIPSVYGNTASPSPIAMMEMPWQDVWWMETGWDLEGPSCHVVVGGTDHEVKIAQAAMKGIKSPRVWRDGGLRCGTGDGSDWPNITKNLAARVYLAESIANDANEWLLEGYDRSMWYNVGEALNYATFLGSWRSASIDRSRITDGAVLYCLPCVMWRAIGPFSYYNYPGGPDAPENLHERDLATVMGVLDRSHSAFEVVLFDHPRFFNNFAGLSRLRPPGEGGYEWIILPSTDAISDVHAEAVVKYVSGGGHAILINSGNQSCGTRDEELAWRQHAALADLQSNPGSGHVSVIDGDMPEAQLAGKISAAILGSRQTVIVSGAPASTLMNVWRHGAGPMVSVNLVNYNIPHNLTQVDVSVRMAELKNPSAPVARLLSLDFVGNMSLPVSVSAGRLHVTVPEIQTHALLIVASSEEEFQCREAAAQTRLWLQRSMLAYRSHALRQASREHKDLSSIMQQWEHLLTADSLLSTLQGDDAVLHSDPSWYKNIQAQLQNSILALQEAMSSVQNFTLRSEIHCRTEIAEICQSIHCVSALNFNDEDRSTDDSPAGFVPVARKVYNSSRGFGFLNTTGLLAFDTSKPDALHRSGIFSSHSATLRIDIDLAAHAEASSASSLVLTLVSGYHDLGAQSVLNQSLGVNLSTPSYCEYKGRPSETVCIRTRNAMANRLTSAWTGFASTSVAVAVRAAGDSSSSTQSPCMLGSTGRNPGYFLTRSCRVNISAVAKASSRLQMDVVLAPDQGMTGCFGHNCGEFAFAWLLNALVVSLPDSDTTDSLPERSRSSLAAADAMSATAVREWMWIGPFDGSDGDGIDTDFAIEGDLLQWPIPALNKTYAGKAGDTVSWKRYTAAPQGSAPYLPLSQLLPDRAQNTGSVAFAVPTPANVFSQNPLVWHCFGSIL